MVYQWGQGHWIEQMMYCIGFKFYIIYVHCMFVESYCRVFQPAWWYINIYIIYICLPRLPAYTVWTDHISGNLPETVSCLQQLDTNNKAFHFSLGTTITFLNFQLVEVDLCQVPSNPAYVLKWLEHCWSCALKRVNWRCLPERCSWNVAPSLWSEKIVEFEFKKPITLP